MRDNKSVCLATRQAHVFHDQARYRVCQANTYDVPLGEMLVVQKC